MTREAAIDPDDCPKLTLLNDLTNEAVYDARTDMDLRGLLERAYDAGMEAGQPQWVRVADRLPTDGERVWFCYLDIRPNVNKEIVCGGHYRDGEFRIGESHYCAPYRVWAWQPNHQPEPYKETVSEAAGIDGGGENE